MSEKIFLVVIDSIGSAIEALKEALRKFAEVTIDKFAEDAIYIFKIPQLEPLNTAYFTQYKQPQIVRPKKKIMPSKTTLKQNSQYYRRINDSRSGVKGRAILRRLGR